MDALRETIRVARSLARSDEGRVWATIVMLVGVTTLGVLDVLVLSHGYTASWYVTREGMRSELLRSVEHRLAFPNERRPLSRYVTGWDFRRFGMPEALPPIDVTLRARLDVPEGGRLLETSADGHTAIRVDGAPIASDERIAAGPHDLEVDWSTPTESAPGFVLRWGATPLAMEDVPRTALVPADGAWPWTRVALWLVGLPALALVALLVGVAAAEPRRRRRALAAIASAAVIAMGLGYRLFDYDVSPYFQENEDELFAMWNGYALLTEGRTEGWTLWHDAYVAWDVGTITEEPYFYRRFHVVRPYFEHPPLLHVLVGAAGWLGGARAPFEVSLADARLVPIALSVVVMTLMLAIGRRIDSGSPAPWLGTLLYATLPWIVLQTRVVKEEALVTPLGLGSVLAFLVWRDRVGATRDRLEARDTPPPGATRWLVLASILAASATLAKVTGLAFSLGLAVLVVRIGRLRDVAVVLGAAVAALGLLALHGLVHGWDVFVFAQRLQTSRPVNFNVFLRFFADPQINHNVIGSGWLLFLWLAAMSAFFVRRRRDTEVLVVPLFAYLAAIALGSGTWSYGWYLTPLLPLLCLAAGRFLAELWREPELGRGAIFTLTLVFYSLNFAIGRGFFLAPEDPAAPRLLVTAALAVMLGPFALAQAFGWRGVGRVPIVAGLVVVLIVSGAFVGAYDAYFVGYHDFDRDRSFGL
ncbi:MAG: hypothetical protein OHK0013_39860 [Sandaracinaceae bacterium]